MSRWKTVKQIPCGPPVWHKAIHLIDELRPVGRFKQMNHLMQDDVVQTLLGLFGQFGVQADGADTWVAASPFRFHMLHVEPAHRDVEP